MNKPSQKFALFFLLLLIIIVLSFDFILFFKKGGFRPKEKLSSTLKITPKITPTVQSKPSLPSTLTLQSPVEKEKLANKKTVQLDYGIDDLAFFLSEGDPIYAAFSGYVEVAGKNTPQTLIVLKSEDGKLIWKYFFSGTVMVKNGSFVKKGEILAKAGSEPLPTRDVNLIIQALKEGKRVSIDQNFLSGF